MQAAFFDIDGTLTTERTWKGLMSYFQQLGLRRGTHLVFLAAHYPLYYLRRLRLISEGGFRAPWAAHLAWYVRGYTVEESQEVWDWAVERFLNHFWRPDTRQILDQHRQAGNPVFLVSSGPLPMVERIARELGAQHAIGTRFEVRAGRFTGRVLPPVVIDNFKASAAQDYIRSKNLAIDLPASFAYADAISDLSLLEMVGHPVAVYPDPNLKAIALQRGWQIFPA
jgi:putative phosphoserine phosphatase / 1-acylglycerol-3-phosphate O-acyltransferase